MVPDVEHSPHFVALDVHIVHAAAHADLYQAVKQSKQIVN